MTDDKAVYGGYTRKQLSEAFSQVKNNDNWKMPVSAVIPKDCDLNVIESAVIFYTGSIPSFVDEDETHIRVHADGYYRTIGS